ncbi:MAG: MCE family protein [Mycolicibacterium sp.]|uniref:Mammalian cell entry protein n=1 Tax=Mycolicibacterium insubricum TaxID=444597 RepID=A0A1X0DG83_9MYCO|nr:MCE family protein [Mycolicibacterium insubricum]MCB9438802.1 MCE family protein [Mycolicibacterium sp.]MCV7083344.1 MCE family protein [Mycolicibacterium insubricum]ORA71179.1 mammalian cell entry protein [Mycolicibacterium insubricum]
MLKYRGPRLIRTGFVGVVLVLLTIGVGLRVPQLASWATDIRYNAQFAQAGGIAEGNDVTIAGIKVGTVSRVALRDGQAMVTFSVAARIPLGAKTTAHIRTGSLLGQRVLTLDSRGPGTLAPAALIPAERTFSPYSLTEAVGDLTTDISGTDTGTLNDSLDALSTAIDAVAPELGTTFDGLTRLSKALNARNDTLGELFKNVRDVSAILSDRSQQVNTLILDGNELLDVLVAQRRAIVNLLANTSAVATQLSGLVHDNKDKLAPTLEKLNAVTAVLQRNRDNIAKTLPGLAQYELTSGELVASGPYYQAMIANLAIPQLLQPFLDYAFGFRRGTAAGQPPDQAGPRAEFPIPRNGIPQQPAGTP